MDKNSMLQELFDLVDAREMDKVGVFFAEDAVFVFANEAPIQGRAEIQATIAGVHQTTKACKHTFLGSWVVDDTIICKGDATFTLFDDRQVTVPFVDIARVEGNQIKHYQVYVDMAPLSVPAEEAAQA